MSVGRPYRNRLSRLAAVAIAAAGLVLSGCLGNETDTPTDERDIRIVGSSTIYPFSTRVAEEFKHRTGRNVVIESTGSGGGQKLLCVDRNGADIANSSRPQKPSENARCDAAGVENIIEVRFGKDGIVLARSRRNAAFDLTLDTLFLALARKIPSGPDDCRLAPNPHKTWHDVDPALPDTRIEVFGPPPSSGTRDAFVAMAMVAGAARHPCLSGLSETNPAEFAKLTQTLRTDGHWIDAGENDRVIVRNLSQMPNAIGIVGYAFLDQNRDRIEAALVDGVAPDTETIASAEYPLSRSLYVYLKGGEDGVSNVLRDFALEFFSDAAIGPNGYLREIGLIPLPEAQSDEIRRRLEQLPEAKI